VTLNSSVGKVENFGSNTTPIDITIVMPAQSLPPRKRGAGIQKLAGNNLDSRFRGNDAIN